jgi:hypothetical protein
LDTAEQGCEVVGGQLGEEFPPRLFAALAELPQERVPALGDLDERSPSIAFVFPARG